MNDITIIFLTVNRVPEEWADFHRKVLLQATKAPIISVSREPMDLGTNLIQDGPINASNIYRQMLRAAKIAETPYVAVAEDDSLYPEEHFHSFRPKDDEVAYNMSRWSILTWGTPTYFWRNRISNLTLIAPRKYLIEALEERFAKYPQGTPEHKTGEIGKTKYEAPMGLTNHKYSQFWTTTSVVNFNHVYSIDPFEQRQVKRMAPLRAFDIPHCGKAEELVRHFR